MDPIKQFDKLIKKKVDEAEFTFNENDWNKLSMQLENERRISAGRSWNKFFFLGLLFLGIASVSIAIYKNQDLFGLNNKNNENTANSLNDESNARVGKRKNHSTQNAENKLAENENRDYNLTDLNFSNGNNSSDFNASFLNSYFNTEKNENNNANKNVNPINNFSDENNLGPIGRSADMFYSSTAKKSENNLQKKSHDLALIENNYNDKESQEMNSSLRSKSDLAGGIVFGHDILDRIEAKLAIAYTPINIKPAVVNLPIWYDEDYHLKGKKRLSFLNAETGTAFLLGWNSKNGTDARGFNWYAGVNYGRFFSKKVGFSVGSQFYNVGNIKSSFYEGSKSVYGLVSTSSNTIITTKSLFYFSVPVKFYYSINATNQVGVSVNTSFLFSSKNVVETYRLTDNIKSNEIKTNSSGIYEGVKLNNVLVSAFYRVKLNKRVFLNTEVLYGVRDIFKNNSFNSYSQKPFGFRLGVQYTLFEK